MSGLLFIAIDSQTGPDRDIDMLAKARRWPMRRRTIALIAGALVLVGIGASLAWPREEKRLYVENFSRIGNGMTQEEVEDLLGGPPGNFGRYKTGMMTLEGVIAPPGSVEKIWCNDARRFEIYFDQDGRVVLKHERASYSQMPPPSWLARLQSWLRL